MKRSARRRRAGFKRNTKLRVAGRSDVAETKRNIQSLLPDTVIERDSRRPHRAYGADWKLAEAALKAELHKLAVN